MGILLFLQKVVDERLQRINEAYHSQDFDTFGQLTMADSNQFHATCLDTYPPIFYMNDTSHGACPACPACRLPDFSLDGQASLPWSRAGAPLPYPAGIIKLIHVYNKYHEAQGEGLRACYTFDAGPNAVLFMREANQLHLLAFLLRYFPAPPGQGGTYSNKADMLAQALKLDLEPGLLAAGDATGMGGASDGDVKMIYCTGSPTVHDPAASEADRQTD